MKSYCCHEAIYITYKENRASSLKNLAIRRYKISLRLRTDLFSKILLDVQAFSNDLTLLWSYKISIRPRVIISPLVCLNRIIQ